MTTFDPYCLQIIIDLPIESDSREEYMAKGRVKSVTQNCRELLWVTVHGLILTRSVLFVMDFIFFIWIPLALVLLTGQPITKLTILFIVFPVYHYFAVDRVYILSKEKINKTLTLLRQHRLSLRKVIAEQTVKP